MEQICLSPIGIAGVIAITFFIGGVFGYLLKVCDKNGNKNSTESN